MAVRGDELELLDDGVDARVPSKGSFALNMLSRRGAWEVRQGFGQIAEFDSWLSRHTVDDRGWGFERHIGSYLMRTEPNGHRQIVSVFTGTFHTGGHEEVDSVRKLYIVSIYDLTTGARWEEPVYRRTAENLAGTMPLEEQHGLYETNQDYGYADWVSALEGEQAFFVEMNDVLYFGTRGMGLLAYIPSTFRSGWRPTFVDSVNKHARADCRSESAVLSRVAPVDGLYAEAYEYLTSATFPAVTAATVASGRLVVASGRQIFFSDVGYPASFAAPNFIVVPAEDDITALGELFGNLYIFTARGEVWTYRPNEDEIVSQGVLERLSRDAGCVGPGALTMMRDRLVWVGHTGVWETTGNHVITWLSEKVDPFFTDPEGLANPLTHFFAGDGVATMTEEQPTTYMRFAATGTSLCYDARLKALLVSVPESDAILCLTEGRWSVWTTSSCVALAGDGSPRVGVTRNIENAWPLSDEEGLYLVGGIASQEFVDAVMTGEYETTWSSYILEYGRGGAIDRSVRSEDDRIVGATWLGGMGAPGPIAYFQRPIQVPEGFTFPGGAVAGANTWLVPIEIVPGFAGVAAYHLEFNFDANWRPVFRSVAAEIDFILPTERISSAWGYGAGSPSAGVREVRCYISPGVPSMFGNRVVIYWSGAGAPAGSWEHQPNLNLTGDRRNPIIYIPFEIVDESLSGLGMGFIHASGWLDAGGGAINIESFFWFNQWWAPGTMRSDDSVAQPVDWAYQTETVSKNDGERVRARGLFARMLSHGKGSSPLVETWTWGLYNTLVSGDWRQWISQVIDYRPAIIGRDAFIKALADRMTIRSRIRDASGDLLTKTFGGGATWAPDDGSGTGSAPVVLIGDEDITEVATSDLTKGQSVSYMVFGFMQDKAERLKLEGLKMLMRVRGGRRR